MRSCVRRSFDVAQRLAANLSLYRDNTPPGETDGPLPDPGLRASQDLSGPRACSMRTAALSHDRDQARRGDALDRVRDCDAPLQRSDAVADLHCGARAAFAALESSASACGRILARV